MKKILAFWFLAFALICASSVSHAVTVSVPSSDPGAAWLGFMNVSQLPSNGGAPVFGSPWGVADLNSSWSGPVLTLSPNTIGDPNEFWYQCTGSGTAPNCGSPGAQGNKTMAASYYKEETGPLSGVTVTFEGAVLSNTFTSAHSTVAFIKDFAPDYSSVITTMIPLTSTGPFSLSLNTIPDPSRHVQYGFETVGPNVWITDVAAFGSIQIGAIPEPTSLMLGLTALVGSFACGRRR